MIVNNTPQLPESWLSQLGGTDASGWLAAFQTDPAGAIADLLWNRFYFGPLNQSERGQLLAGWLDLLEDNEGFAARLDTHISHWVEANWGTFEQPGLILASAWSCLAAVVEFSAKLPPASRLLETAETLRDRFTEREQFLGSFSTAPAADPLGIYLAVVAEFQGTQRSLASFWHRLCDLPDGVPFYHARYALLGLRRLRAANDRENGSLRAEVVLGLIRLANALDRMVRERGLGEKDAKTTFRLVAAQAAAAYPDSPRWSEHGLAAVLKMPSRPQTWVVETIRPLAAAVKQERAKVGRPHAQPRPSIEPNPDWTVRAKELADALRRRQANRLPDVERLLGEQRRYAEETGDTYFVVRSLCNFASRIFKLRPVIAVQWAEEARVWEPANPFTWSTIKNILLKINVERALRFAWVAWKRFPEDVVSRNGLAKALQEAERFAEAEAVYRETTELFPENIFSRSGLAEVLKDAGRFDEAEAAYRETIKRFPENIFSRSGLAAVLKVAGRFDDAEAVYRETIERFPADSVARNGLAEVLKVAGRFDEAEAVYRETVRLFPESIVSRSGLAEVLKVAGRFDEAEAVYREIIERFPESIFSRSGLADTLRRAHRWGDAETVYRDSLAKGLANYATYVGLAYLLLRRGEPGRNEALTLVNEVLRLNSRQPYALELKQKLESAQGTAVMSIADTWNVVADELLSRVEAAPSEDDEEFEAGQLGPDATELVEGGPSSIEAMFPPSVPYGPAAIAPPPSQLTGRPVSAFDPLEVAALAAEAGFYRVWGARSASDDAIQRRRKAAELLTRAERLFPGDAKVMVERIALECSQAPTEAATNRLTMELGKHPASTLLLVLKARLDRAKARQTQRRLTDQLLTELLQAPTRLRDLNPALIPVFHLEKGLAALALLDGSIRIQKAADAFSNFRRIVARRAGEEQTDRDASRDSRAKRIPGFHEWLQSTTDDLLFKGFREDRSVSTEEVPALEQIVAAKPFLLEEIESSIVDRLAFADV